MRNKTDLKTPSPHPSLLPRLDFSPDFLYFLPSVGTGGLSLTASFWTSCPTVGVD